MRPAPRVRPLAAAALILAVGEAAGLAGHVPPLLPAIVALVVTAAAILVGRRTMATAAALLTVGAAAVLIGDTLRSRAARDCRAGWASGRVIRITVQALSYLPDGARGPVRARPARVGDRGRCIWADDLRLWADGPMEPGALYRIRGRWTLGDARRDGLAPPAAWGWIVIDGRARVARDRALRHPLLSARAALAERLWHVYPRRWAPFAEALVLGERGALDREVYERMARAGLAHVLAISGLHVGLLAAGLLGFARSIRLGPATGRLSTVLLVFGYVLLIGAPASALRAATMLFLWALNRLRGQPGSPYDMLGLAAIAILLVDGWAVVDPGFQLSFAGATAVAFAGQASRDLGALKHTAWRLLFGGVAASLAATALTAPFTVAHFNRVAPASVVGNVVAIPLVGLAMPALLASAVSSPWPSISSWPAAAAVTLLYALDGLAGLLAEGPWASVDLAWPGLPGVVLYVLVLIAGAQALHGPWYRRRFILMVGMASSILIAAPAVRALVPGRLEVHVLDVGQGEAVAVATPRGRWLLVDAGPRSPTYDAGALRVVPFLRSRGVRRLDAWIVSHPDLDHVGGGPAVLEALDVGAVVSPGRVTGQVGQRDVLRRLAGRRIDWIRAGAGDRLELDQVTLSFLSPPDSIPISPSDVNEGSLVFVLEFGEFRMMFTGDAPRSVEDRLLGERGVELRATVLKVGHHGSASSTSRRFLAAVRPTMAVISAGRGNRYGHPAAIVLARLRSGRVQIRRTDLHGRISIDAWRDGRWRARSAAEGL